MVSLALWDWPFERKMSLLSSALITHSNISQRLNFSWDRSLFAEEGAKIIILISKEAENHNGPWNKIGVLSFFRSEIGMCVRDFCRVRGFPHYGHHHYTESRELFFGSTMPRQLPWINNARSSEINSLLLWENVPFSSWKAMGKCSFRCKSMPTFLSQESHD